jgi:hypothetical protein
MDQKTQQMVVAGLTAVAAILAITIGVIVYQSNQSVPAPTTSGTSTTTGQTGATGGTTGGTQGGAATNAPFDAKTATKVPAGTTPEQFVKAYYQACSKGDFAAAYKMLPLGTQTYYGDAAGFEKTLKGYGISGFDVKPAVAKGDEVTIVGVQKAQGMDFAYTWTLVKVGGQWYVKSREMGGK